MGILSALIERRSEKWVSDDSWYSGLLNSITKAGVRVTESNAMQFLTVYACNKILANTIAAVPLELYRYTGSEDREKAKTHPLYKITRRLANPEMSASQFKRTLQGHLGTWGNAFSYKEYDRAGRVVGLWPMLPDRVLIQRNAETGKLEYPYFKNNKWEILTSKQVWHIPAFGFDGITGYSPVGMARNAVGLGMAMEEFNARFYANGAKPGAILQHPQHLSVDAQKRLTDKIMENTGGIEKSWNLLVLEEGMTLNAFGMKLVDAEFLASRKFTQSQIAGEMYQIPLHMIGNLDRATFSNIENQQLEYHTDTMLAWYTIWQDEAYRGLLSEREQEEYFFEFNPNMLIRGDLKSRYEAYSIGRNNGVLSVDDINRMENKNSIGKAAGGDVRLAPLNYIPLEDYANGNYKTQGKRIADKTE